MFQERKTLGFRRVEEGGVVEVSMIYLLGSGRSAATVDSFGFSFHFIEAGGKDFVQLVFFSLCFCRVYLAG